MKFPSIRRPFPFQQKYLALKTVARSGRIALYVTLGSLVLYRSVALSLLVAIVIFLYYGYLEYQEYLQSTIISDEYSKLQGIYTLHQICHNNPQKRQQLFLDASWTQIRDCCIKHLKDLTTSLSVVHEETEQVSKSAVEMNDQVVVGSIQKSNRIIDFAKRLFMEDDGSRPVADTVKHRSKVEPVQPPNAIPSLLQPKLVQPKKQLNKPATAKSVEPVRNELLAAVKRFLANVKYLQYFINDTIVSEVEEKFIDYRLVIFSAQILSKLIVSSKKEDKYGVVHLDVPVVLETLAGCHQAIEEYIARMQVRKDKPVVAVFWKKPDPWVLPERPLMVLQALELAIYSIITQNYAYLHKFKFDGKVIDKIQRFVDFKQ